MEREKVNWSAVSVIIIGTFMSFLNGTIVNVALPKLMAVFGASSGDIQWILSGYMMTLGVVIPLTGYLGDTYGYKSMYSLALGIFTLGSALCGFAPGLGFLVGSRVLQAVGGGIMQPLGMALIYRVTPRDRIGMVLGIWGIAAMAAPVIGLTLGGYLVDYLGWRLIFYINVPVGLFNIFLAGSLLEETPKIKGESLDVLGVLSSIIGLFCLLLALSKAPEKGWTSPYILGLVFISILSLTFLVINELSHPEPIVELRLLAIPQFALSVIVGSIINMGLFGGMFLIPLFIQTVMGQSAMKSGIISFPAALATAAVMPIAGRLFDRYGPRWLATIGLAVAAWTTYMLSGFSVTTSFAVITFWLVLRGIGMGMCFMPVTTAGMNAVPLDLIGRASALGNAVRQVAAALGVAMFTTIMQHRQVFHFSSLAQGANFGSVEGNKLLGYLKLLCLTQGMGQDQAFSLAGYVVYLQIMKKALANAIDDCFVVASLFCVVALFLALFLKDIRMLSAGREN